MRLASVALIASVFVTAAAACYVGPTEKDGSPTTDQDNTDPEATETGLPCEIEKLFAKRCTSCHSADADRAPMALVTYDDLVAKSPSDDTQTNAELSLVRMKSEDDPMPPGKATKTTSAEQKLLAKWISDDYPHGSCGAAAGDDDDDDDDESSSAGSSSGTKKDAGATKSDAGATKSDAGVDAGTSTASVCTSGVTWSSSEKSTKMNPGRACISCHESITGDPILQVGGTIYPTSHEPDKCYGVASASVVITDANNRKVTVTSGTTGNFTVSTAATALVFPISVKVVSNGKERAMQGKAPHGDCNACHTEAGKNGAPGRILLPQ